MDAYQILGVGRNASEDEIKTAYKNLIKKYHPDNYVNNPLSDLAAEKTKEVNEAYDRIMNERKNVGNSNAYNNGSYGNSEYQNVRNLINQNRIEEAEYILNNVGVQQKNAEWHFLKGNIFYKRGWLNEAFNFYSKAINMEPGNAEYKNAMMQMRMQRNGAFNANPFGNGYNQYPRSNGRGCTCLDLICLDSCCECMGGDLISCC